MGFCSCQARCGDQNSKFWWVRMTNNVLPNADGFSPGNFSIYLQVPNSWVTMTMVELKMWLGIEALEQYFGMDVDKNSWSCRAYHLPGCEGSKVEEEYKKIQKCLRRTSHFHITKKMGWILIHQWEHEAIFDSMIAMHNNASRTLTIGVPTHISFAEKNGGTLFKRMSSAKRITMKWLIGRMEHASKSWKTCYTWKVEDFPVELRQNNVHTIADFCKIDRMWGFLGKEVQRIGITNLASPLV